MASKIAVFDRIPLIYRNEETYPWNTCKKLKNSSALKKTALYND